LRELLRTRRAAELVHEITGIPAGHPLEPGLVATVADAQAAE
jgi:hypothetical protein